MKRNIDLGLLILRVGLAAMLLTHGIPKFMDFIGGNMSVVGDPIGIGELISTLLVILAEFIAPVLILIGLKTRMAAILVMILMAVAAFVVHAGDPIGVKEKALIYLIGFTAIALMGAGKISVDKK
jgi:putative oxidoreductase